MIVNPAARGGLAAEVEARAACARAGIQVQVVHTHGPGDAGRIAATAVPAGHDILVLGGDGTVAEVAGATAGSGIPVGIIPAGTGNQIARYLGISLQIPAAIRQLAAGTPVHYDVGRLDDGRCFVLAAGLGIDSAIMAGATRQAKRRFGVGAYAWSAVKALRRAQPFPLRVEVDGVRREFAAELALVANVGTLMNGHIRLGPDVRPDDGWLDACVYCPAGFVAGVALAARMARGALHGSGMHFLRGRRIVLEAPPGVLAEADGELLAVSRLAAEVLPLAATFIGVRPAEVA